MTESEAIERCEMLIKGFSVNQATYEAFAEDGKGYPTFNTMREFAEACKYALEEVEQYRAIGTVEEFKAIKQWKSDIIESFSKYDVNSVDELMKRFKELTEKAELEADCCEWKLILGNTFVAAVSHENEVFTQTDMKFCPYCRKRIKIVRVE